MTTRDAFQMTQERRWDNSEWPEWLNAAWQQGAGENGLWCSPEKPNDELYLGTKDGVHVIKWGEWIVRLADGSLAAEPEEVEASVEEV